MVATISRSQRTKCHHQRPRSSFKIHADEEIESNCYSLSVNPEGSFNGSDNNDDNILIADVVPEELDLMMETAAGDAKEDSTKFEKSDALDGGFLKFFFLSNSISVEVRFMNWKNEHG
ncbi:hypothetical protein LINPERHAP2_LOCUS11703 [Linum perenne]